MALSYEEIESVICNESLVDPRPLPCGHSYCGPPRDCLNSLNNNIGGIRCAVCRVDHNLKSTDIKPLYGIREWFQGCSKAKTPSLPCSAHENMECTFWCYSCNDMICASCFEDQHDGHSIRALKKYLVEKIESHFGKPLFEGIVDCRENLRKFIDSRASKLVDFKLQMEQLEKEFNGAQNLKYFIDEYSRVLSKDTIDKNVYETMLLFRISQFDSSKINLSERSESSESDSGIVRKMPISTPTENNVSCNSSSAILRSFKFLQGPSSSALPLKKPPAFPCIETFERNSLSTGGGWEDDSVGASESDLSDHELLGCDCVLKKDVEKPLWAFPIAIQSYVNVHMENRGFARNDNYLHVCPFKFHVTANLVKHKFKRNEQMFRVIVRCSHLHDYGEILPPSNFRYGLTMYNTDGEYTKKKDGYWEYPKFKDLHWYSITYSELLDPLNRWIDIENDVLITLELERWN